VSSFFGINVALSALRATQYAMDVTGHNIANANTEGYRRQDAIFTANAPHTGNLGTSTSTMSGLGTGVAIAQIKRTQTNFLDNQIRSETQLSGMWNALNESLQQIEPLLVEPGDSGISAELDNFWNSWQQLATSPESIAARVAVVSRGISLSDKIRNLYQNMRALQEDLNKSISDIAQEINSIAKEIASINNQTVEVEGGQTQPNDLIDRRDLLIEQLSGILRIEVHGSAGVNLIISVGGKVLVQGNYAAKIDVENDSNGAKLIWSEDGSDVAINGGELQGLAAVRDTMVAGYITSLDTIADTLVQAVNAGHILGCDASGNPAGNFFVPGTGAGDMRVEDAVSRSPSLVAASSDPTASGDNTIANAIASLRGQLLIGNQTVNDAYAALVAHVGADAREASVQSDAHKYTLNHRKTERDSMAGVSLDEEMANMVRFQQSYNAAARIFTVINEMLETIINTV